VTLVKGEREVCSHARLQDGTGGRAMLPQHEAERRGARLHERRTPRPEESRLAAASPVLGALAEKLRKRHGGRATREVRQLDRMWKEYPTAPLCAAVERAMAHGLYDLGRIEKMVLERVAGDFFQLPMDFSCREDDASNDGGDDSDDDKGAS